MWKKVLLGLAGLLVVVTLGLFFWARSVLTSDRVRTAIAGQISASLGQPVTIGSVSASIYPRVHVTFTDVHIGDKTPIEVRSLNVGTDFRALLSRRIEHATLRIDGARVPLPLPPFALANSAPTPADSKSGAPVELVSIDEIVLKDVDIVSGGHTLRGYIEVVPEGKGIVVKKVTIAANDMTLTATGRITNLAGPVGTLAISAGALNFDQLLIFANEFAESSGFAPTTTTTPAVATISAATPPPLPPVGGRTKQPVTVVPQTPAAVTSAATDPMNLSVSIEAERAMVSGLTIDKVVGHATATQDLVSLNPLGFNLFGGRYEGALSVTLGTAEPTFRWTATVSNVDVAKATTFAGAPNTATGTLNGKVDLTGRGTDAARAMKTVKGTVRLDVVNGVVRNLGLVRSVGAATALSLEGLQRAAAGRQNVDEPFTRLGGTVMISDGVASTQDLQFEASDLSMSANGTAQLDGSALNLHGQLQLSEALSQQVHQKMLRLSQQEGRVTLPATITGTFVDPNVRVDAGTITRRAIMNTATDEAPKLLKRGLGGLIRR